MTLSPVMRDTMLAIVPSLRAYAMSLSGNFDRADDLVQETLLHALAKIDLFEPGTNMLAWLFTILRNVFLSECRKNGRELQDSDGIYAQSLKSQPEQYGRVEFQNFRVELDRLPASQREALILVGALGFSYDEVAAILNCPAGTVKSRVSRARLQLADRLSIAGVADFGPDRVTRAVFSSTGHPSGARRAELGA
jgi:RNA polymerase sigma-70 factor, ECF subfamily